MKNFFSFLTKFNNKKIICFDGGGVRTIASIVFLKKLEAESGKKVADIFDMFIGTSAGAFNAACFAFGPAAAAMRLDFLVTYFFMGLLYEWTHYLAHTRYVMSVDTIVYENFIV